MLAHGKDYWDHIVPLSLQTNGCFCFVPILIFIFLFRPVFTLSISVSFLFSFSFPLFLSFCLLFFSLSFVARLRFLLYYLFWMCLVTLFERLNQTQQHPPHPPLPPPGAPVPFFFLLSFPSLSMSLWKEIVAIFGLALLQTLMWHCTSPQCQE